MSARPRPPRGAAGERWRRERRGRSGAIGPLYRSGYLDAFLTGRLEDGRPFALATGSHARHFPYHHPRSKWDDLMLVAGDERLLVVGRHVSALALSLTSGRANIGYQGPLTRQSGALVDASVHLGLDALVYPPRAEGLGIRYTLLGLQWQPALVRGSGLLTLQGRRLRVAEVHGAMERGSLTNVRGRWFHFGYDYTAVASPTEPAAHVRFQPHPLHGGLASVPLTLAFRVSPVNEDATLAESETRVRSGDALGLARRTPEPEQVLVEHSIDIGPAHLHRQLLRIGEGDTARHAFRQYTEEDV